MIEMLYVQVQITILVKNNCRSKLCVVLCLERNFFVAYMAPEVFTRTMSDGHGRAADIWSVGCVVVEMASGKVSIRKMFVI